MARKTIRNFQAKVSGGCVHLSFFRRSKTDLAYEPADSLPPCRVYRKEEPAFVWGQDGMEYFDGLDHRQAEVIYRGPLPLVGVARGEYVDSTAKVGSTYAYWIAMDDGELPSGPVAVGVYDPGVWWPQAETERRLEAMAAEHPNLVTLKVYGHTVMGRPLRALMAGRADNAVAAVGTFHAGEAGPELLVPTVERLLAENPALLERAGMAILPSVNIDSRQRIVEGHPTYVRKNARDVDLNRNCPTRWETIDSGYGLSSDDPESATYRGPAPASEPETQAVLAFLRDVRPRVVFTYHWLASICGTVIQPAKVPSSPESAAACQEIGTAYARGFYGDSERGPDLRPTEMAGSLVVWVNEELGVPAFCVECPDEKYDAEDKTASRLGLTTPELLKKYQARHWGALSEVMRRLAEQGR